MPDQDEGTAPAGPRSGRPGGSAAFAALLALHAEGGPGERLHAGLADRVAARLAQPVRAVVQALQRVLGLGEHLAGVVGERHLVLPGDVLGADVSLVVAGAVAG